MTRINTNVESLIARRTLTTNNQSLNQALQRLSTGLRINSGRDDPAGLIASETLRSSIRAIGTAIDNSIRADTIVAVAEGGLQEVSALLLELESLVDQTANQAGLTDEEVAANQQQVDSILATINRLSDSTAFGDKKLLDGTLAFTTSGVNINEPTGASLTHLDKVDVLASKFPNGSFQQVNIDVVTGSTVAMVSAVGAGVDGSGFNTIIGAATTLQVKGIYGTEIISFASGTTISDMATRINASKELTGVSATASAGGGGSTGLVFQSTTFGSDATVSVDVLQNLSTAFVTAGGALAATNNDAGTNGTVTINGGSAVVKGLDVSINTASLSLDLTLDSTFGGGVPAAGGSTSFEVTGGGAIFSISPTVGLSGQEALGINSVSTGSLGSLGLGFLSTLGSGSTNDLASKNFTSAQRVVRQAINQVASLRGRLGNFQKNTLGSTINSLGVALENVTAAESAIRDADFAVETSNLTRAQILVSSSTSVLQLANAQPQNALALLG